MSKDSKRFPSMFRVSRAGMQLIPNAFGTIIEWDTEFIDELDEMAIVNPWAFVPKRHGYYHLSVVTRFVSLPPGSDMYVVFLNNGAVTFGGFFTEAVGVGALNSMSCHTLLELDENSAVQVQCWQLSGAPQNLSGNVNESIFFGYRVR